MLPFEAQTSAAELRIAPSTLAQEDLRQRHLAINVAKNLMLFAQTFSGVTCQAEKIFNCGLLIPKIPPAIVHVLKMAKFKQYNVFLHNAPCYLSTKHQCSRMPRMGAFEQIET